MPSVKASRHPRARPKQASETERIEREYRRLALAIRDVDGFRLYLATYNDPRRRDQLIERLIADGQRKNLEVTRLDVSGCSPEASLVRLLREHLNQTAVPPGKRQAVMVVGLEQLLDYYGQAEEGLAVFETANLQRDAFPKAAPVPVVFWLSPLASSAFPKAAPDLWHWRGASFDFTGHVEARTLLLRDLIDADQRREGSLSTARKAERAALLEELISELNHDEASQSARRMAERAGLLDTLGKIYLDLGRPSNALRAFEQRLKIAQILENRKEEGDAQSSIGLAQTLLGRFEEAKEAHEKGLEIARDLHNRLREEKQLVSLSRLHSKLDNLQEALHCANRALEIAQSLDDKRGEAAALDAIADAYLRIGEPWRAIEHLERCLATTRVLSDPTLEALTLIQLSTIHIEMGTHQEALDLSQRALTKARESPNKLVEALVLLTAGLAYGCLGEHDRAADLARKAREIVERIGAELKAMPPELAKLVDEAIEH